MSSPTSLVLDVLFNTIYTDSQDSIKQLITSLCTLPCSECTSRHPELRLRNCFATPVLEKSRNIDETYHTLTPQEFVHNKAGVALLLSLTYAWTLCSTKS